MGSGSATTGQRASYKVLVEIIRYFHGTASANPFRLFTAAARPRSKGGRQFYSIHDNLYFRELAQEFEALASTAGSRLPPLTKPA
jgi:hypothetical protein